MDPPKIWHTSYRTCAFLAGRSWCSLLALHFPVFFRYHLILPLILGRCRHRSHFFFMSQHRLGRACGRLQFKQCFTTFGLGASHKSIPMVVTDSLTVGDLYRRFADIGFVPVDSALQKVHWLCSCRSSPTNKSRAFASTSNELVDGGIVAVDNSLIWPPRSQHLVHSRFSCSRGAHLLRRSRRNRTPPCKLEGRNHSDPHVCQGPVAVGPESGHRSGRGGG
ncbi:hypothetical protein DFH09DRAFT_527786 [Mycena vulgaris]|nr:hypothetical protein DFH09DRAFT_223046 [Mycena vulgaris]KAJ6558867.1 hypothetical protein DFH09DRAFT_527786 [Mycena vulgaris]